MFEMSGNMGIICIHKISRDCLKIQSAGKRTWQTKKLMALLHTRMKVSEMHQTFTITEFPKTLKHQAYLLQ